jgi:hypothetical protein
MILMRAIPVRRSRTATALPLARAAAGLALALGGAAAGCAEPAGALLIVQNQKATLAMGGAVCEVPVETGDPRLAGRFDVALDRFYPYFVYPLVANRLASVKTLGGVERNTATLRAVRVAIRAPSGVDPGWVAGCPGSFDSPASAALDPGASRSLVVEGLRACHAERLHALIEAGAIPGDGTQRVFFTLELQAVADRSGSELLSPSFPFDVEVCAGCLQPNFPVTPTCSAAPKPNPYQGNPCNIAQDTGPVLCCDDEMGHLVCPAPDL